MFSHNAPVRCGCLTAVGCAAVEDLQLTEAFAQKDYFRAAFEQQTGGQEPPASLKIIESHGDQVGASCLLVPSVMHCCLAGRTAGMVGQACCAVRCWAQRTVGSSKLVSLRAETLSAPTPPQMQASPIRELAI